jgi:hypothetical protein
MHVPQLARTPPHPSLAGPHVIPWPAHVSFWQLPVFPHWPGVPPPPHVSGGVHGLQSGVSPPHPSLCCPQVPAG